MNRNSGRDKMVRARRIASPKKKDPPVRFRDLYNRADLLEYEARQKALASTDDKQAEIGDKGTGSEPNNSQGAEVQSGKDSDGLIKSSAHQPRKSGFTQREEETLDKSMIRLRKDAETVVERKAALDGRDDLHRCGGVVVAVNQRHGQRSVIDRICGMTVRGDDVTLHPSVLLGAAVGAVGDGLVRNGERSTKQGIEGPTGIHVPNLGEDDHEDVVEKGRCTNDESEDRGNLDASLKATYRKRSGREGSQEPKGRESTRRRKSKDRNVANNDAKLPAGPPSRPEDKAIDNGSDDADLKEWIERKHAQRGDQGKPGGGAYIPPMKLKAMQAAITDKNSQEYQRMAWDQLKKHIHGLVNRVNASNIVQIIGDLFKVNLIRGRGIFVRAIMQAQSFAQPYSSIMAALAAVVNSKFPTIGELLLHRLLSQFKRAFRRNDRDVAVPAVKFIAHLINQQVAHEVLALELLTLLLENPTDDSVELSVAFLRECGARLTELSPVGINAIFDRLRSILHEAEVDPRVQFMIEVLFQIRKDKFVNNPAVAEGLDLVEDEDQITHAVSLDSELNLQEELNLFKYDPEFEKNEQVYEDIRSEILESDSEAEEGEITDDETEKQGEQGAEGQSSITDLTETNLVTFRRTVYLTIQSSLEFQEAIHKLLKMDIKPGYEGELCNMILDCCAQQRTYEKFYGLMAERFCRLKQEYQHSFESLFKDVYTAVHRFEVTKLRNSARLFAHLFFTDAISWMALSCIRLTETDTTSPSRIFIKILFHELVEFMGLQNLFDRTEDATMQAAFDGLFPRDNPHNTRFAINFYTSIGLGGLTIGMREHLKTVPKEQVVKLPATNTERVDAEHD
uniref:Lethal protein 858 n=1 Tax=Trichuris muris TaxID=70415 RepID=A0A5S6QE54_TRIMR